MKQKPIMPKEHFDAIAAQLRNAEEIKSLSRPQPAAPSKEVQMKIGDITIIDKEADYEESMKILEEHAMRPITYQEALSHSLGLIAGLKGKWFYLGDQGISKGNSIYTFNSSGELVKLVGSESIYQRVRVFPGNRPLFMVAYDDINAQNYTNYQFALYGDCLQNRAVPVVVGITKTQPKT